MKKEAFQIKDCSFNIRHIQESDVNDSYYYLLAQLTEINIQAMDPQKSRDFINNLDQNHCIFVIEYENTNQIVATGTLFIENKLVRNYGKVGHIEDIVVDNKWRGYGLGKCMVDYLGHISKERKCYKCILDCSDSNAGFYEKCSYKRNGSQMSVYF